MQPTCYATAMAFLGQNNTFFTYHSTWHVEKLPAESLYMNRNSGLVDQASFVSLRDELFWSAAGLWYLLSETC